MGWLPRLTTAAAAGSATFLKFCRSGADIKTIMEVDSRSVHLSIGSSSTVDISTAFVELARHVKGELKDGLVQKMLVCAGAAAVGGVSYLAWRKYGRSITRRLFQNEDDVEEDHVLENNGVDHEDDDQVNHDDVRDEDSEYSDGDDGDDDDVSDEESDTSYPDLETYVYGSWGRGDAATMFSDEEIDVPAMPATRRRVQRSRKSLVRAGRSRDYTD
ncbi:uncharacterized protein LOC124284090 [Haliotis rubra]|uniref:uncharacterized protein LOC124284090 n=1 Tax=Haliotis rubra TaxID=36100 RepID=UPI001EE62E69|nr:uncharacterized protein LOC124284090 [Haliotis rubra]